MSEDRKKPLWPWIVALVIVLPVLYVASFGPLCWYAERCVENTGRAPPPWLGVAYFPLGRFAVHGPSIIAGPLRSYSASLVSTGAHLYLPIRWREWDISLAHGK